MDKTEKIILHCTKKQKDFLEFLSLVTKSSVSELLMDLVEYNFKDNHFYEERLNFIKDSE